MKQAQRRNMTAARFALLTISAGAMVLAVLGQREAANAYPKYAKKENKPCSYCHVKAQGGGPRNEAGTYYGKHNHSFVGYKPKPAGKK